MLGDIRSEIDSEQVKYNRIAGELDDLQKDVNHGRGIATVRDVANLLRRGKHHEAKSRAWFDAERLEGYDEIKNFIRDNLFDGNAGWLVDKID